MPDIKRDQWDRYLLPDPITGNERAWTRATTLANALKETYGLERWGKRMVVLGLASREDLYDLARASDPDDKQQLDDICDKAAAAAKIDVKSHWGTALHKFTQRYDQGEVTRAPDRWAKDLEAYVALKEKFNIITHPRMCERITVVPELETAGTMDKVVKHNGDIKIADLKTGSTVEFSGLEIAMQTAIYAHGEGLWNMERGEWDQMPAVSQTEALVIHLPAGQGIATLYSVDIAQGWEIAKTAYTVRKWRKDDSLLVPYTGQ